MPKTQPSREDDGLIVEFCIRGPAISARAKNRERLRSWKENVATTAGSVPSVARAALQVPVEVHLVEFSAYPRKDRDNLAKPILDAMQGIVYENDRQVRSLLVEWRDIDGAYKVRFMSSVLAAAMTEGVDFVWVRIRTHAPRQGLI